MHGFFSGFMDLGIGVIGVTKGVTSYEMNVQPHERSTTEAIWLAFAVILSIVVLCLAFYEWFWNKSVPWTLAYLGIFIMIGLVYWFYLETAGPTKYSAGQTTTGKR
jgi:cell division protein FtsW (lipid II flippase)